MRASDPLISRWFVLLGERGSEEGFIVPTLKTHGGGSKSRVDLGALDEYDVGSDHSPPAPVS